MFGLPGDTHETMKKTLDLSLELNTITKSYAAIHYISTKVSCTRMQLRKDLIYQKIMQDTHFIAYTTKPLPTDSLSPEEILKFRDEAYLTYHTDEKFLNKVKETYGEIAVNNIIENTKVKLKRKILGD